MLTNPVSAWSYYLGGAAGPLQVASADVNCEPRSPADPPAATAPPAAECFVGDVNLAAWLIAEGLVQLAPDVTDKELVAADASARNAMRGLWSDSGEAPAISAQPRP